MDQAAGSALNTADSRPAPDWQAAAARSGLNGALPLRAVDIQIAEWVRLKCRYGCPDYGRRLSCAPHSPSPAEFRRVIAGYSSALLVWIEVDGAVDDDHVVRTRLHRALLDLEREAFLSGSYKAFAVSDGPCTWCSDPCPADGHCRTPERLRPAMPSCGIDVFATAAAAGLSLAVVAGDETRYKHVGLLLIE